MKILAVNTFDVYSGAERCVQNLHKNLSKFGHGSWLAVGFKRTADPRTFEIPNDARRGGWAGAWNKIENFLRRQKVLWRLCPAARFAGQPARARRVAEGYEDFDFPGSHQILQLPPEPPDVLHLHVLQGGYFDLRILPQLTNAVPTVLTMHDEWLYTGHCSYAVKCDRWRGGCGECPDLSLPPAVSRDRTAENWKFKRSLFQASKLQFCAPSRWLLGRVADSIFAESVDTRHVVPYGIETDIFRPARKNEAREKLSLPSGRPILIFSGRNLSLNPYKDVTTIREAIRLLAAGAPDLNALCLLLGEKQAVEDNGKIGFISVPHQSDPHIVAAYYAAADVYLHAARSDNLPLAVLEASACGTPVVASAIGGISEEIRSLNKLKMSGLDIAGHSEQEATGILVPAENPAQMAEAIEFLLRNPETCVRLGNNASRYVEENFSSDAEIQKYLSVYELARDRFSDNKTRRKYSGSVLTNH